MKWAPTLLVLAAFGVLLYVSSKKPDEVAAQTSAAKPQHDAAPAASHGNAPAPAAAHAPVKAPAAAPQSVPAAKGEETPAVEVVKPPAAPDRPAPAKQRPDSLVGAVKDAGGQPVAQVVVKLAGSDGKAIRDARTDGAGRFAFDDVAAGNWTLTTYDPDYLYTGRAQTKVVTKQGAATEVELRVDRGRYGVRGTIVDGGGKPVADKRVTLTAGGAEFSVMTDPKGRFLVSGLAPGEWRVMPDGVARQARTVKVGSDPAVLVADVELALERKAAIDVTLAGSHLHRAKFHGGETVLLRRRSADEGNGATLKQGLVVASEEPEGGHHASEQVGVAHFTELDPGEYELEIVDAGGTKSLIQLGTVWSAPIAITLREGETRPVVLPTALASFGRGTEVPTWVRALMFIGIGLLILATPILFPPPLVPKRPAKAGAAH